jgi:serine/threonine protein kinase
MNREETIFEQALEIGSKDAREAFLRMACCGDAALLERLQGLLRAHDRAGRFLGQAGPGTAGEAATLASLTERAGDRIGRYKLLQQIGEGGCGVVYMAEQEEPVRRRVALKVIKPGMDTRNVIARFEAERQALALMDHPNIARVFDAGATESGRPYFVMELVRGVKITEYCDEKHLSTRERLDLFIKVCQAVQHAHQKGIIHRDLKPSNILVTVNDGVPVPKVIDFGIAKATTDQQLTDKTLFTAFDRFIGTPAYMSPEQAEVTSVDIDTRSDIYSLGVLLYELLTGTTPFDARLLLQAGLDEMRKTIREKEPVRPSTRVSTLGGDDATTTAKRRGLDAPRLANLLRGDLDWIVMRCLEKDRARRYETANGLAMDLQRYLGNEPVLARPPSWFYGFQKTVRRHKLAFAAASAVAFALLLGLASSTVLYWRERSAHAEASRQKRAATEQAAIAQAVQTFLVDDLLKQASSFAQAERQFPPDPNLTVREALERATARIGNRFKDEPLVEAEIRYSIGEALLGVGEAERAIPHFQRALDLRQARLGPNHVQTMFTIRGLGAAYGRASRQERALALFDEAVKLSRASLGAEHPQTLLSMHALATGYQEAGKLDQALRLGEEVLTLQSAKLGADHPDTLNSMATLANTYGRMGKLDQSLKLTEEVFKLRKASLGAEHPVTLNSMNNLAAAYAYVGKLDQALPLFEEAFKLNGAKLGLDHPETLASMGNLGVAYFETGKSDQALPLMREVLKGEEAKLGPDHPGTLITMQNLESVLRFHKDYSEADALSRERLARTRRRDGPESEGYAAALTDAGEALLLRNQWAEAEPLLRESLGIREKLHPDDWRTFSTRSALGRALLGQGKRTEAEPLIVKGYNGLKERKGSIPENSYDPNAAMDRLVALADLEADEPQAALWKTEIERVRHVNDVGALRRWLILDPIALEPGLSSVQGLEIEQLDREAQLRPRAGDRVSVGGVERVWRERVLSNYAIDFNELQGEVTPRSVAYAVCYVKSATLQKGLVLKVGSDDQAQIYLNGHKLYEQKRPRGLKLDEDTVSDVELRAGLNVVVFKVVNGEANWRGSLRFATRDDRPVTGIEVTLDPADADRP